MIICLVLGDRGVEPSDIHAPILHGTRIFAMLSIDGMCVHLARPLDNIASVQSGLPTSLKGIGRLSRANHTGTSVSGPVLSRY